MEVVRDWIVQLMSDGWISQLVLQQTT